MNRYKGRILIAICFCALLTEMTSATPLAGTQTAPQRDSQSLPSAGCAKRECVVLVHGLGRTPLGMKPLEWYFRRNGYRVVNVRLPWWRYGIEQLANVQLHQAILSRIPADAAKIHFVTHSMGGIVVRQYLSNHTLAKLGRVVMLAPPNEGCEIADFLKRFALGRLLIGASGCQLGTSPSDLPRRIRRIDAEIGIIAGDRCGKPLLGGILPRPNDGTVSVKSARLEEMSDFLVVHTGHNLILLRGATFREAKTFLEHGRFQKPA
jgi:triacylglycerol lipase